MNILLVGNDSFYLEGLKLYLSELFENVTFIFSNELNERHVRQSDIIIISTFLNELLLCHEEMLSRRLESMLIFMVDREPADKEEFWFTNCIEDAILINEKSKPEIIGSAIQNRLREHKEVFDYCNNKCDKCSYKYLTDTQFLIAYAIRHQFSIDRIAKSLDVSVNTVTTHLERIKKKFMLRTNQDLWRYVTRSQLLPMAPVKPIKNCRHV